MILPARAHVAASLPAGSHLPDPEHLRVHVNALLETMLADHDGVISPVEAPLFFRQSGLPDDILSLVWQYSTAGNAYNAIVSPVCTPTLTEVCAQQCPTRAVPEQSLPYCHLARRPVCRSKASAALWRLNLLRMAALRSTQYS